MSLILIKEQELHDYKNGKYQSGLLVVRNKFINIRVFTRKPYPEGTYKELSGFGGSDQSMTDQTTNLFYSNATYQLTA